MLRKSDNKIVMVNRNNFSSSSKISIEALGYIREDGYPHCNFNKFVRRAPVINPGYYVRHQAINFIFEQFLKVDAPQIRVISCGAGYAISRYHVKENSNLVYIDVDIAELIQRKQEMFPDTTSYFKIAFDLR